MTKKPDPATKVETPALVVGTAFSLGAMSEGRIMALAAASAMDSNDPVDQAAVKALREHYPAINRPWVEAEDVEPAHLQRRYSLARVRACDCGGEQKADLVVMRGDVDAVLAKSDCSREQRAVMKRNAAQVIRHGWRPLAIASAPVNSDNDKVGAFEVKGFVPVCPETAMGTFGDVTTGPAVWARVRVWSGSLRIQHWMNVALVFILSCTGLFILDPSFYSPSAYVGAPTNFTMGWIRLIHFTAAFVWLVVGATRIWSAFTSRDRYLRWPSMWPLKSKEDVRNLGRVIQHYIFIKREAPLFLAHNPLQQLTYLAVYVVCGIQMVIGFSLYGLYHQSNWFWELLATPTHWIGIPMMRMIHVFIMFALWAFVIAHIYLVLRAESLERHGGLSAMFNGGVWVKRGSQPVDGPIVE